MDCKQIRKSALELAKKGSIIVAVPKSVGSAGDMLAYQLVPLAQKRCPMENSPMRWIYRSPNGNREVFVYGDGTQLINDEEYLKKFVTMAYAHQCDVGTIIVYE